MKKRMPIGIEDFKEVREQYYLVDKTRFIQQLLDEHGKVTLLTRPRRFGKTLTMSMLEYFFSIDKADVSQHVFQGLYIETAGDMYTKEQSQYPVIFLSFKELKNLSWDDMLDNWGVFLRTVYLKYKYVYQSERIDDDMKDDYRKITERRATRNELANALARLMEMLSVYYGKRVIVLIDEYDVPVQKAWEYGFYDECINFVKQLLGNALKTNETLEFAVLTGVLRIAKESIFSDLNNFEVCSVLHEQYNDAIGFTPTEIQQMAQDLQMEDLLPEIKKWYDGYHFGSVEIYNPWSVLNFFKQKRLGDYWVNTSGNTILSSLLQQQTVKQEEDLLALLRGTHVFAVVREGVTYEEIYRSRDALYTMLVATGYLTVLHTKRIPSGIFCELALPNREVQDIFQQEVLERFHAGFEPSELYLLVQHLVHGEVDAFSEGLKKYIAQIISVYDTAHKESFYHGLVLGMTALVLPDYTVESNRESGYGRFDIALFPKRKNDKGVILEFKVANCEDDLEQKSQDALQQIQEKKYDAAFLQRGVYSVWKYGIAFCGKHVHIVMK